MADVGIKISATDATKPAFDSVSRGLGTIQSSAASVAGALAGLGIGISVGAFVAMTKSIVDGLDAMNDLKDATGSTIENISALEDVARRSGASFETLSGALIKLNQGLNSAKPGSDTEAAIKAIGLSVKDLKALDPAEAFQQVAVALSGFADDANKARLTQELFGKSLKEVAPLLNDVAASGQLNATVTAAQAEEAEKFNKQLANLQKNATDLGRSIVKDLIPSLNNLFIEMAAIKKTSNGFWDGFFTQLSQNNFKTAGENAAKYRKEIESLEEYRQRLEKSGRGAGPDASSIDKSIELLKRRQAYFREVELQTTRFSDSDNEDAVSRRFNTGRKSVGDLPDQSAIRAGAAAAAKALSDQNREIAAQNKLIAENAGLSGSFAEDWERLSAIFNAGKLNMEQLTEAQAKLLGNQPAIRAYNEAEAKAAEAIDKANKAAFESRLKYVSSLSEGVGKLQLETQAQQEYIDRLGLSKEAIAALDAAKLESQAVILDLIAIKELDKNLDEEQFELYKKQSAELRKQAALKVQGSVKEAQLDIEKEITAERKRGWEETDRIARDVFTSWATEGGNAAQKIGDTLKKSLLSAIYEATLKPLVFQLYTSIAGGGGAGAALQAASGAGSALSSGSNLLGGLSSITGAFGSALSANFGATVSSFGSTIGLSIEGGLASIAEGTGASIASGLGSIAGALGPIALGVGLLSSLSSYKVESRGNGLTATVGGSTGLPSGSVGLFNEFSQSSSGILSGGNTINRDWSVADQGVATYIAGNVQRITASNRAYADALGLTSEGIDSFTKNIEVSLTGLDAAGQQAAIDAALSTFGAEQAAAAYGTALASVARDGETTAQTLQRLGSDFVTVNSAFKALGYELLAVGVEGANAASKLAAAFGGLGNFQAQTAALYQNFYTKDEQKASTINGLLTELKAAGVDTDFATLNGASRQNLRDAVDLFKTQTGTAEGDKQYAAVVATANRLSAFVDAFDTPTAPGGAAVAASVSSAAPSIIADNALTAWEEATAAIVDAMRDLRTTLLDSGPDSFAKLQAQFVIETASANAGNLAARQELPQLARTLADMSKNQFTSGVQRDLFVARLLETLGTVVGAPSAGGNLAVPRFAAGGYHSGGWAMVGEQGPELVNMPAARVFNATDTRAMLGGTDPAVLEELRAVRAELAGIRASSNNIATSSGKTAEVLKTASNGGQPLGVKVIA